MEETLGEGSPASTGDTTRRLLSRTRALLFGYHLLAASTSLSQLSVSVRRPLLGHVD